MQGENLSDKTDPKIQNLIDAIVDLELVPKSGFGEAIIRFQYQSKDGDTRLVFTESDTNPLVTNKVKLGKIGVRIPNEN